MVPHTNAYQQHAVNGLMAPIKATCDGDKFEKFELLKERFKSFGDKRTMPGVNDESAEVLEMMNDHSYHQNPHQFHQNQESSLTKQIQQQISASITFMTVETDLKEIRDFLRTTRKRMENKEAKTKTVNDWKQVALVLDRTFFFIILQLLLFLLPLCFRDKTLFCSLIFLRKFYFIILVIQQNEDTYKKKTNNKNIVRVFLWILIFGSRHVVVTVSCRLSSS